MTAQFTTPESGSAAKTTVIAEGTKVNGTLTGAATLIVEGVVEGRLRLESEVTVGSAGLVKGEIKARSVRVGGKVEGNIEADDTIEIGASGSVQGDVKSPRVVIADGAFFKGKVEMGGEEGPGTGVRK